MPVMCAESLAPARFIKYGLAVLFLICKTHHLIFERQYIQNYH